MTRKLPPHILNNIQQAAKGYNAVLQNLRTRTCLAKAGTIDEIYASVRDAVTGRQQVSDAIKKYYAQKLVYKHRTGRNQLYWIRPEGAPDLPEHGPKSNGPVKILNADGETVKRGVDRPPNKKPEVTAEVVSGVTPEVTITEHFILINHEKFKVKIEF